MELELQQQELLHYEPILTTTLVREETMEMIVPDALPDILNVLDTGGMALLGRRECAAGCATVTGTLRFDILYHPEGMEGVRPMTAELPFQLTAESEAIPAGALCVASPRLTLAETRVLNPRKVLIRGEIATDVTVYARKILRWCGDIPDRENHGIQQRLAQCRGSFVRQVTERPFSFGDTLSIPGSKAGVDTILRSCVSVCSTEEKVMGSKLIFKGSAMVRLLYRSTEGTILSASFDLPFSQMLDEALPEENAAYQLVLALQSCDITIEDSEGRQLSLELDILAQAVLWESCRVDMVTDAYSICCPAAAELAGFQLPRLCGITERRYTFRELMDAPAEARDVLSVTLLPGQLRTTRRESLMEVSGDVRVNLVCEDAAGEAVSLSQTFPFTLEVDAPQDSTVQVSFLRDETAANVTAGGLELRAELVFQILVTTGETVQGVTSLTLEPDKGLDYSGRPSIVLRQLREGETLWDIAKAYCTTSAEIERANELHSSEAVSGRMLLIPRKR